MSPYVQDADDRDGRLRLGAVAGGREGGRLRSAAGWGLVIHLARGWTDVLSMSGNAGFRSLLVRLGFFFFQAEDGIRDKLVTGVQTCALPISSIRPWPRPSPKAATGRGGARLT